MKKEPVKSREMPHSSRSSTFDEVVLGYNEPEALREAERCLQCKDPLCQAGCPVGVVTKPRIELDRLAGEPLDVLVNGTLIAHGEVVVVNEKFGIRLTDVISPSERIKKLR